MKTTKGYSVKGICPTYSPNPKGCRGYAGCVMVGDGSDNDAVYAKWDDSGKAWRHEYGDLIFDKRIGDD